MKLHEREKLVNEAESKITAFWHESTEDLTDGECLRLAASVFADVVGGMAKYMIRHERHGNTDEPGGLE